MKKDEVKTREISGDWKKLSNPRYFGSWDLDETNPELVVTVEKVHEEEVTNPEGKKEWLFVAILKGLKPMILNVTNRKRITKLTGTRKVEEWKNFDATLYIENIKAFGEFVDAIRIKPTKPKAKAKPAITPERFEAAITAFKAGTYDITKLAVQFTLTKDQAKEVVNVLNPAK